MFLILWWHTPFCFLASIVLLVLLFIVALLREIYSFCHTCCFWDSLLCWALSHFTIVYLSRILFSYYSLVLVALLEYVGWFFFHQFGTFWTIISSNLFLFFNFLSFLLWVPNFTFGRFFSMLSMFLIFLPFYENISRCCASEYFLLIFSTSLIYLLSIEYLILFLFLLTKIFVSFYGFLFST